jgi:hypothetical protein
MDTLRLPFASTCLLVLLALAAWLASAPARAELTDCTAITTTPYVISAPGHYCLHADLATAAAVAVRIDSDDVVLDCNGHMLQYTGSAFSTYGILAFNPQRAVTVRHCAVQGYQIGISVSGNDVHIVGNEVVGANRIGINTGGSAVYVEDNHVRRVTATPFYGYTIGIYVFGLKGDVLGVHVLGNTVTDMFVPENGPAIGLRVWAGTATVRGNTISNLGDGGGVTGMILEYYGNLEVTDNVVLGVTYFPQGSTPPRAGIQLRAVETPQPAVLRDNVVGHFGTNIQNDAGTFVDVHNTLF